MRLEKLLVEARERVTEIDIEEFKKINVKELPLVLDVREKKELQSGFIPQATHLSKSYLECKIESLAMDANKSIVLYCQGGVRSLIAANSLAQMGYKKVYSLKGGFSAWENAGEPIAKD